MSSLFFFFHPKRKGPLKKLPKNEIIVGGRICVLTVTPYLNEFLFNPNRKIISFVPKYNPFRIYELGLRHVLKKPLYFIIQQRKQIFRHNLFRNLWQRQNFTFAVFDTFQTEAFECRKTKPSIKFTDTPSVLKKFESNLKDCGYGNARINLVQPHWRDLNYFYENTLTVGKTGRTWSTCLLLKRFWQFFIFRL